MMLGGSPPFGFFITEGFFTRGSDLRGKCPAMRVFYGKGRTELRLFPVPEGQFPGGPI